MMHQDGMGRNGSALSAVSLCGKTNTRCARGQGPEAALWRMLRELPGYEEHLAGRVLPDLVNEPRWVLLQCIVTIIIMKIPDQAIASTPSAAPRGGRKREHRSVVCILTMMTAVHQVGWGEVALRYLQCRCGVKQTLVVVPAVRGARQRCGACCASCRATSSTWQAGCCLTL
jgi:hypothetical protein